MYKIKVTVFQQNVFWVGVFEREDDMGYATARHVFGKEPTDPELYQFVSNHFYELNFTEPQKEIELIIKRRNFKRMSREVRKEMSKTDHKKITHSEEVLKEAMKQYKKIKKTISKEKKLMEKEKKFELKQEKKKQKQRGH